MSGSNDTIRDYNRAYDDDVQFDGLLPDLPEDIILLHDIFKLNRYAINRKTSDITKELNILNTQVSELGISYEILNQIVTNISGIDNIIGINDLSSNFYNFLNLFNKSFDLSDNLISIKNDISINANIYNYSELSYNTISNLDNSNNIILNLRQLNEFLDTKILSDTSGSVISTVSGSNEYVNDVSQTFYQIMTQQPYNFDTSGIPKEVTTSSITLSWYYDSIMAKHDIYNASLAFLSDNKQKQLPYINTITLEISGNVNGNSSGWINLDTISIPNNVSYNQQLYKIYELIKYTGSIGSIGSSDFSKNTIISSLDNFDLRIYGSNFSEQVPSIAERSIYFYNISFPLAKPPSTPNFKNESINNNNITFTHDVSFTELDNSFSDAVLTGYIIDYSQNDTLSSIVHPLDSTDLSYVNTLNNIQRLSNFNTSLNNLRSGTKYNYVLAVKSDLNDFSYSEYSLSRITNYTRLPTSNNTNTNLNLNINSSSYTPISSDILNNSNIIYINLSGTQYINLNNNIQTIEISRPHYTNQYIDTFGYGKYIDNSLNLVSLTVSVNSLEKQKITFDGSFVETYNGDIIKLNSNSFDYINLNGSQDIWFNNINNQGFRINGSLQLYNINNNDIITAIGDPSSIPYILNYNYNRHSDVGGSNQNIDYNIYVDDLSLDPVITGTNSTIVKTVVYNFGIPSVATFDLSFSRNYNNINSQFGYIPGDKIISKIYSISNTSSNSIKDIILQNNEIVSNGTYFYDSNSFDSKTTNYYNNLNYTTSVLNNNFNLSWNEYAYNLLVNGKNHTFSTVTNHHVDYNSFNRSGTLITSSKINLSDINIAEISNISLLGSDLGNLELDDYNDHTKQIREYTLLHYNNQFQSHTSLNYPVINDFSYNDVTITNNYNSGITSYDLTGIKTNDNSGYKWIVFKLYKSGNSAYIFNNNTYSLSTNDDNVKYLNLKSILTQTSLFSSNDIDNLFEENNLNALGFARVTRSDSVKLIGNFKQLFNPTGGNWNVNGSPASISYNDTLQLKYGSKVIQNSNNYGIYLSPTAINDDLTLFIAIKNN